MERKLSWSLGEPYYVNIFTHILIMMYRITRGNALPFHILKKRLHKDDIFFTEIMHQGFIATAIQTGVNNISL
jgi:hypothetical protein